MLRRACVAGQFYPGGAKELQEEVRGFIKEEAREKATALIAPHAGYIYSGSVAGAVYSAVDIPDDVVLLGPNHTGLGARASVMTEGEWEIPTGTVGINTELAGMIAGSTRLFSPDTSAHLNEHSLEVQLPFIHCLNRGARFVPITVMQADLDECIEMGNALAGVIKDYGREVLIAVSSDMNHYESDKRTREKDKLAIDQVLSLDARGLLEVTARKDITMCGVFPAAIAITAARALGASRARLIKYATSGETSGDYDHVVGYAGIVIS
ncbi:MAG TPA: AmmeMemoRadiSam system protein B [Thermodesulfobacteriota bacterium]|nr:AmmeMemoRadiSam system protein B [Thermodesulfobacteriota bacterium]